MKATKKIEEENKRIIEYDKDKYGMIT